MHLYLDRSLLGVLRTFSQLVRQWWVGYWKSTWGFENLFPTNFCEQVGQFEVYLGFWEPFPNSGAMPCDICEVYLGFWEPFPNTVANATASDRSLLGVLRTFSQPYVDLTDHVEKSTWGFENLFPTRQQYPFPVWEVYLGFWEPFPNRPYWWTSNGWSLLGVLRTFSQLCQACTNSAEKSTWGFENLFPTANCLRCAGLEVYLGFREPFPNRK